MSQVKNEIGNVYGRLTVIDVADKNNGAKWLCQCECGNKCIVSGGNLRSGSVVSCGCYRRRMNGASGTPEYYAWYDMHARCTNTNHHAFHNYGGAWNICLYEVE